MFPAYAGMIRRLSWVSERRKGVPRLRGDDPIPPWSKANETLCSPPTRG